MTPAERQAFDSMLGALKLAVRQNGHDMLMTGEELRKCEAALSAAKAVSDGLSSTEVVQPQREGWMPIDSAPKDEKKVLLFSTRGIPHAFIDRWIDYCLINQPHITHWQPLPPPPASPQEQT